MGGKQGIGDVGQMRAGGNTVEELFEGNLGRVAMVTIGREWFAGGGQVGDRGW